MMKKLKFPMQTLWQVVYFVTNLYKNKVFKAPILFDSTVQPTDQHFSISIIMAFVQLAATATL